MPIYQCILQGCPPFSALAAAPTPAEGEPDEPPRLGPATVFAALHAALHRAFPQVMLWEHTHAYGRNGRYPNPHERAQRFGSLQTAGPFPCGELEGGLTWFFTSPADVVVDAAGRLTPLQVLTDPGGRSNLPKPLQYPLANPCPPTPDAPPAWWPKRGLEAYLAGERSEGAALGVAPESCGPAGDSWGVVATMPLKTGQPSEGLEQVDWDHSGLILGGQARICHVKNWPTLTLEQLFPVSQPVASDRVKWLLLSPAIFPAMSGHGRIQSHPGGWLPSWVCPETGRVLLKKSSPLPAAKERQVRRRAWQAQAALDCQLVAACIPKPIRISGWSQRRHLRQNESQAAPGPKASYLAVPAGSVYYFAGPDAALLSEALSWHGPRTENQLCNQIVHRRSTLLGEQGFGLGVCGPWR